MELVCKKCGCTAAYKSGHVKGVQRYKCKQCGHQYTRTTPHGRPEKDKILALALFLSGLSMNMTGKILGVSTQSVMRWIRKAYDKYILPQPDMNQIKEVELDEMHHFYQKKTKKSGFGKLLIIEAKNSSDGFVDIVIPKH